MRSFWGEFVPKSWIVWKEGYPRAHFMPDLFAGLTVAIVALPLAMAFAIASGVEPQRGLYTAIVAGILVSLFGGSRVQIGGPTGAFVVIIYDIVMRHGYEGLALATLMAGFFLILMGFFRFGAIIKYIPYPVITGFTSGIALIIFTSQIKDFLGLPLGVLPSDFLQKWALYAKEIGNVSLESLAVGGVSILLIIGCKRFAPKIPGPIVAVIFGAVAVQMLHLPIETIESRFGMIPSTLPTPSLPAWSFEQAKVLVPDALTIALLAAIESLLCAVVADGMTGYRHRSNTELIGQGIANLGSVFFGGIPATGAIARTATSIKSGAKSPLAGILHGIFVWLFMFFLASLIVKIPLATLAGILIVVAWNMSEIEHFRGLLKAPRSDVAVLLSTFLLTVLVDLTVAVQVGVVLAAILFIKRISEVTEIKERRLDEEWSGDGLEGMDDPDATSKKVVPLGVEIYEINGPFFFGVADRLKGVLDVIEETPKVFILRMRRVPVIDATGMHALWEFQESCEKRGTILLLSGVSDRLYGALNRFGFIEALGEERVFDHIDKALAYAKLLVETAEERGRES
ncbi:MAG: sulfate permease [Wolinella succinogenes]|uniref:SulP family inorganic anion transporter n=1 Tax=Wolinella succinogenes TaxID=844 RepID=UPI00169F762A|nr:sulfate permease [Wolinella succinogenes]NLU34943.1 sulfate permease [Wolinella succinogenes]